MLLRNLLSWLHLWMWCAYLNVPSSSCIVTYCAITGRSTNWAWWSVILSSCIRNRTNIIFISLCNLYGSNTLSFTSSWIFFILLEVRNTLVRFCYLCTHSLRWSHRWQRWLCHSWILFRLESSSSCSSNRVNCIIIKNFNAETLIKSASILLLRLLLLLFELLLLLINDIGRLFMSHSQFWMDSTLSHCALNRVLWLLRALWRIIDDNRVISSFFAGQSRIGLVCLVRHFAVRPFWLLRRSFEVRTTFGIRRHCWLLTDCVFVTIFAKTNSAFRLLYSTELLFCPLAFVQHTLCLPWQMLETAPILTIAWNARHRREIPGLLHIVLRHIRISV